MGDLRQGTAVTVEMGPFLDEDDGKTPETGLTILKNDVRLAKGSGAFAAKNSLSTITHEEKGFYPIPVNAIDTNTLGRLKTNIHKTGALPVFEKFMVISQREYDAKYGVDSDTPSHLVEVNNNLGLTGRAEVTNGTINRASYPRYGVIFTDSSDPSPVDDQFDVNILEGALIRNTELLTGTNDKYFQILGGYFYDDSTDTVSKVFGIALTAAFGITEGGATIIDTFWSGTDLAEDGQGNGWTFIVAAKSTANNDDAPFPSSGDGLKIYINPAYQRKGASLFSDGRVHVDAANGTAGIGEPLGSIGNPVTLIANAIIIAARENLKEIIIHTGTSDYVFDAGLTGYNITQTGSGDLDFNSKAVTKCSFLRCNVTGTTTGVENKFNNCRIFNFTDVNNTTIIDSELGNLILGDDYVIRASQFKDTQIDSIATGSTVYILDCTGVVTLADINGVGDVVEMRGFEGKVSVPVSNTNGILNLDGVGEREFNGGGITINDDYFLPIGANLSTFNSTTDEVDIGKVKGVGVTNVDSFKANVSGLSTFNATTDEVDIGKVKGVAVTNIGDFQASVSGLALQSTALIIKGKTDNLPADPASQALIAGSVWNAVKTSYIISNSFGEVMMELASGIYNKWRVFRNAAASNAQTVQLFTWAGAAHKKGLLRDKNAQVITELFQDDKPYQRDEPV